MTREGADPALREPGRTSLLVMLASFAGLTVVVVAISFLAGASARSSKGHGARATATSSAEQRDMPVDPAVAEYLGPLAKGAWFGRYRIVGVEPITAARLRMQIAGEPGELYEIDARANFGRADPASGPSVTETPHLTLSLYRDTSTPRRPEGASRALLALAEALRARERAGHMPPVLGPVAP